MNEITIGSRRIGFDQRPFIIAEMSGNHNRSLDRALAIVDAAAASGAHGLKIQTYTADTMTLDVDSADFRINDPDNLWDGSNLHQLYQQAYTPWEWHQEIFERCKKHGMVGFSTPFDATAVEFLEQLDVPCYKIASFEVTDIPLLEKVAATGKTVIMSTGMATVKELDEAIHTLHAGGNKELILLKCTSTYPATPVDTNLRTIPHLRDLFKVMVGLSDHTLGTGVAIAAVALGATVIEKHFTLARADGGVDSAFSIEPAELRSLVDESERARLALGSIGYGPSSINETKSLKYRRSIYVAEDIGEGELLTERNLRIVRPAHGLAPKHLSALLGRHAARALKKGTAADWNMVAAMTPPVSVPEMEGE
jgi:N-acetylneuraminate synthase